MAVTSINSEDWLVQATFAEHLEQVLGWDSIYAWNEETFGPDGTLGRADTKEAVLTRDLRAALQRLNPDLPASVIEDAVRDLTPRTTSADRWCSTTMISIDCFAVACPCNTGTPRDARNRPAPG